MMIIHLIILNICNWHLDIVRKYLIRNAVSEIWIEFLVLFPRSQNKLFALAMLMTGVRPI